MPDIVHEYQELEALINERASAREGGGERPGAAHGEQQDEVTPLIAPLTIQTAAPLPWPLTQHKRHQAPRDLERGTAGEPSQPSSTTSLLNTLQVKTRKAMTRLRRRPVYRAGHRRGARAQFPSRKLYLHAPPSTEAPRNIIRNTKYNALTFIPKVLYEQFRYFFNLYFLGITITQFFPPLKVGFLFTYIAPLVLVLSITMCKELIDDVRRAVRDRAVNNEEYMRLRPEASSSADTEAVKSKDIVVGDVLVLHPGQRVPADCVVLHLVSDDAPIAECYAKSDQLDGETDWKMRRPLAFTQERGVPFLTSPESRAIFEIEAANKRLYSFAGRAIYREAGNTRSDLDDVQTEAITLDNTIWASMVLTSPTDAVVLVVYTGGETRQRLNTNAPRVKAGLFDHEVDRKSMYLFWIQFVAAFVYGALSGHSPLHSTFYLTCFRFLLLFSALIPISLRVNIDLAKILFSILIRRDKEMQTPIVRSTTIPEQLGRVGYVMSDKTGTLTQNSMTFRSLRIGVGSYDTLTPADYDALRELVHAAYLADDTPDEPRTTRTRQLVPDVTGANGTTDGTVLLRTLNGATFTPRPLSVQGDGLATQQAVNRRLLEALRSLALCNTVTPILREGAPEDAEIDAESTLRCWSASHLRELVAAKKLPGAPDTNALPAGVDLACNPDVEFITLQASSPDEISLVHMAAALNLTLRGRTKEHVLLQTPLGTMERYRILYTFPFTSASKRMGIVLQDEETGQATLYMKGADSVMLSLAVGETIWVSEQVTALASKGLRTLVFGQRDLTQEELEEFGRLYKKASEAIENRAARMAESEATLLRALTITAVTGVEDRLQQDVKLTIQNLQAAGIRVFLLTGDKSDTSRCIATSTGLLTPGTNFYEITRETYSSKLATAPGHSLELMPQRDNILDQGLITGEKVKASLLFCEYIFTELERIAERGYVDVPVVDGDVLAAVIDTLPSFTLKEFRGETVDKTERKLAAQAEQAVLQQTGLPDRTRCKKPKYNARLGTGLASMFILTVSRCPSFICARCSPEQKAIITKMVGVMHTDAVCCDTRCRCRRSKVGVLAIGDGGNDVSMIQAASVGVGLAGKEGQQASLAADFSLQRFSDLSPLLLYHGRLNTIRAYGMAHFIFGRGLAITVMQAIFSALFYFSTVPLFTGWLLLGYTVVYTSLPIVAICLDKDLPRSYMLEYPRLYQDSLKNVHGSTRQFLKWIAISIFQGTVIMFLAQFLIGGRPDELSGANFYNMTCMTFTTLIIVELLTLGFSIHEWTPVMFGTELLSLVVYVASIFFLPQYFDYHMVLSLLYWVNVIITATSATLPPYIVRWLRQSIRPTNSERLRRQYLRERCQRCRSKCERPKRHGMEPSESP